MLKRCRLVELVSENAESIENTSRGSVVHQQSKVIEQEVSSRFLTQSHGTVTAHEVPGDTGKKSHTGVTKRFIRICLEDFSPRAPVESCKR